jgi:hypothetical protein
MDSEEQLPPAVRRWRVECLGGPWWDGEPCVRFVDLLETQSLFDLHDGIQAAIAFDGEYPFCFFRAPGPEGPREMIPGTLGPTPLREEVDVDAYEGINAWASLPAEGSGDALHYVSLGAGGDWFFRLSAEREPVANDPSALYPETVEGLSYGPDPMQYGHDLDDFAESEESLLPGAGGGEEDDGSAGDGGADDEEDDD